MKKLILLNFMIALCFSAFGQGATTASMNGVISDEAGMPLIGVNVLAKHEPSGTVYGTITDTNGNYRIANMRVGGPYNMTVTYVGFADNQQPNQFLQLGEKKSVNVVMKEGGVQLDEVVITGSAQSAGIITGSATNISSEQIETMPTLGRNLSDYTRLTPQSRATFGGGTSLGGQNNRYNAIYVDGAVNNDVFGLAGNGQNGGQIGIAPFSIDAIDQIQVVLSPYDVSYGGFAGGGISAVTKSGTNEFQGSFYYFLQNERLAGKTNKTLADRNLQQSFERERLDTFNNTLYGFSIAGPIIKSI